MADESNDNAQTLLDAGMRMAAVQAINDAPFVVVPSRDDGTCVLSLEHLLPAPLRTKRTVTAHSLKGFLSYWSRHVAKGDAASVYADLKQHKFVAIIDDDLRGAPAWGSHRIVYGCPTSPEHDLWFGKNGQKMRQTDFALFIEQNLPDVIDPPAADLLAVSRELVAKKSVDFQQAVTLSNGAATLSYQETVEGSTAKGSLRIPEVFSIGIPIFLGGPTYKVDCRLRYTIPSASGVGLMMWFDIDRPHKIIEAAFEALVEALEAGIEGKVIEATV